MLLSFIRVVECIRILFFLFLCRILLYGYTAVCLSVHQLMVTWVVSRFCGIMNKAANTFTYTYFSVDTYFSVFGKVLRSGTPESYVKSLFNSKKLPHYFPKWPNSFAFSPAVPVSYSCSLFLPIQYWMLHFFGLFLFQFNHSNTCMSLYFINSVLCPI